MQEQNLQTVFALLTEWYHVYKRDLPVSYTHLTLPTIYSV